MNDTTQEVELDVPSGDEVAYDSPTYNAKITAEQLESIFEPDSEPEQVSATVEETDTAETPIEEQPAAEEPQLEESSEPEFDGFVDEDGNEYSLEDIKGWRDAAINRDKWQKSNTEKSQSLADERKKWEALKDDPDLVDAIRDYLGADAEKHPFFDETVELESEPEITEQEPRESAEVNNLKHEMAQMKAEIQVEKDIKELVTKHPELQGSDEAVNEVINLMLERNLPTLEDAYIINKSNAGEESAYRKAVASIESAKQNKKVPVQDGVRKGVREAKVPDYEEYREIRGHVLDNYELFK